jgi:hypothetical protein
MLFKACFFSVERGGVRFGESGNQQLNGLGGFFRETECLGGVGGSVNVVAIGGENAGYHFPH